MDKSPDAFRTISEVADTLDTPAHVLRFWESRFPQIKPVKRAGGRRYYRPSDVALLTGIKRLLHDEGLTIRGVQKILRDHGVRHVAGLTEDSVSMDDLVSDATGTAEDSHDPQDAYDTAEAGFIAVEDDEPDPVPQGKPVRAPAEQSVLPLFDTPPSLARSAAQPLASAAVPRKPKERTDSTFASQIRALPRGRLRASQPQLAELARKLAALRARLAARAEGGGS
jgi:DNA-binding transcriptional MerR regulator